MRVLPWKCDVLDALPSFRAGVSVLGQRRAVQRKNPCDFIRFGPVP
jgi:hypothetical protein